MEEAYAAQQEVIDTLQKNGDPDLAARLERCMTARQQRHYGSTVGHTPADRPLLLVSSGYGAWMVVGHARMVEPATTSSLAIIPMRRRQAYLTLLDGSGAV